VLPPTLACGNFLPNVETLREFALDHGFGGIDWSFNEENLPRSRGEESDLAGAVSRLYPLRIRYHCFFLKTDLGAVDPGEADRAGRLFRRVCRLVSRLGGKVVTIHIALGRDSTSDLSWEETIRSVGLLVRFAANLGVRVCIENLRWGWTSRPALFEKLIRKTGAFATLDIGHARVSPSVTSRHHLLEDFLAPHPDRILNAHVYHEETTQGHMPPRYLEDIADRLRLLTTLPLCRWWVLELREEESLLHTMNVVRQFLAISSEAEDDATILRMQSVG
jgi:sugar phosphate isomerase/epimerase